MRKDGVRKSRRCQNRYSSTSRLASPGRPNFNLARQINGKSERPSRIPDRYRHAFLRIRETGSPFRNVDTSRCTHPASVPYRLRFVVNRQREQCALPSRTRCKRYRPCCSRMVPQRQPQHSGSPKSAWGRAVPTSEADGRANMSFGMATKTHRPSAGTTGTVDTAREFSPSIP